MKKDLFKKKRILITSGPTAVAIDAVRFISNAATGTTGIILAEKLAYLGAKVDLLLGKETERLFQSKNITVSRFKFFGELKDLLERKLKGGKFDIVIHAAAVSDFEPKEVYRGKIDSGEKTWRLSLVPTPKLIRQIKKIDPKLLLVGFKFIPDAKESVLLKESSRLMQDSQVDLVVANTTCRTGYKAFIVDGDLKVAKMFSDKNTMADALIEKITEFNSKRKTQNAKFKLKT